MKNIKLLLIILSITFLIFSFSCKKNKKTTIVFDNDIPSVINVDMGRDSSFKFKSDVYEELSFELLDTTKASVTPTNGTLTLTPIKIGDTKLIVKRNGEEINSYTVHVNDTAIYIPVPTGKLLLKGVNKEASVKVIIREDLKNEEVTWELENNTIVKMETQGVIAHFTSLVRGSTLVTIKVGDYTNSFMLYVTNIRGDLE